MLHCREPLSFLIANRDPHHMDKLCGGEYTFYGYLHCHASCDSIIIIIEAETTEPSQAAGFMGFFVHLDESKWGFIEIRGVETAIEVEILWRRIDTWRSALRLATQCCIRCPRCKRFD